MEEKNKKKEKEKNKILNEGIPDPKQIEKEIGDFLAKKFGGTVKVVSPVVLPREVQAEKSKKKPEKIIDFDLTPEELIFHLDQYIVKQDDAKAVLATKICTHFNRIKRLGEATVEMDDMVGSIKNNVLMIGPTGVGKTYMIKLIAKKIGVPFAKGDATKFSETGYVGGDVEDLVRDLVREADDDICIAQYGIVYIDEIDKIASSRNLVGADISRTGVQRALLKPMEDTDVEMKVQHDPISMIQEIERYRKTGKREKRTVNTKNILFIMSGAFSEIPEIITRRMTKQNIGFGAQLKNAEKDTEKLKHVKSEDLIEFGFESEFIGRLPVIAVFERLSGNDLYEILKNPSNPIILGKRLDFSAYGIDIKFDDDLLRVLARRAFEENTGARGLVSAMERALLLFEKRLPSTSIKIFSATTSVIDSPGAYMEKILSPIESDQASDQERVYKQLVVNEKEFIKKYLVSRKKTFSNKYNIALTAPQIDIAAEYYSRNIMDIGIVLKKIKSYYDEVKKIELYFFNMHDINIIFEDDAVDYIIEQRIVYSVKLEDFCKELTQNFEHGLKLIREKTGKNRFFITKDALVVPDDYISNLIKKELKKELSWRTLPAID
ncbi:MAG: AAA family ATPase [Deltaproteobacteria bacterium]|nr:AAA family ATPase [Deltaproteobacteria bacterium]